ncbi:MAG: ankyrin repeat domain-containing protein [Bdellovibrionota bacterium]|jgi:hypothetical protein
MSTCAVQESTNTGLGEDINENPLDTSFSPDNKAAALQGNLGSKVPLNAPLDLDNKSVPEKQRNLEGRIKEGSSPEDTGYGDLGLGDKIKAGIPPKYATYVEPEPEGFVDEALNRFLDPESERKNSKILENHDKALLAWAEDGFVDGFNYVAGLGVSKGALNRALKIASREGYLDIVKSAVENFGAQVNIDSSAPLILASKNNRVKVVDYLISKKAYVNSNYCEALKCATKENYLEVTKSLVKAGASVTVDNGEVFLNAVNNKNLEMMEFLISKKPQDEIRVILIRCFDMAVQEKDLAMADLIAGNIKDLSPELKSSYKKAFGKEFEPKTELNLSCSV